MIRMEYNSLPPEASFKLGNLSQPYVTLEFAFGKDRNPHFVGIWRRYSELYSAALPAGYKNSDPPQITTFHDCFHRTTMTRILHPILALLASATRQDLARQVAYLKEENRILRARLPERLVATGEEKRRLLKVGQKLGTQLKELMSFVSYQTFSRWLRERAAAANKPSRAPARKPGRPKTDNEIREIVLKLARENAPAFDPVWFCPIVRIQCRVKRLLFFHEKGSE